MKRSLLLIVFLFLGTLLHGGREELRGSLAEDLFDHKSTADAFSYFGMLTARTSIDFIFEKSPLKTKLVELSPNLDARYLNNGDLASMCTTVIASTALTLVDRRGHPTKEDAKDIVFHASLKYIGRKIVGPCLWIANYVCNWAKGEDLVDLERNKDAIESLKQVAGSVLISLSDPILTSIKRQFQLKY